MNIFDPNSKNDLKKTCVQLGLALFFENTKEYEKLYNKIEDMRKQINEEIIESMKKELNVEMMKPQKHLMTVEELKALK